MISDRDEHIMNQIHVISMLINRSEKQRMPSPIMSKKYGNMALQVIDELMDFIEPDRKKYIKEG